MAALQLQQIRKTFGPVQALKGVTLEVEAGEVHAIIGENGAGKSTLMKILSGAHQPDSGGEMRLFGKPYAPADPAEGRRAGIAMIYQELTLARHLTVEENVMLGREVSSRGFVKSQKAEVKEALSWLGQDEIYPHTRVGDLSVGKQQMVEIARAIAADARIVIMDEPTSSLSGEDTQALFRVIRRLKEKGISVLYISHFLEEIKAVCDRFTVLRDGESVASGEVAATEIGQMIHHMVGRPVEDLYPRLPHTQGEVVLEVRQMAADPLLRNASFTLRRGEILGIAGLVGAGRSEMIRSIFGLQSERTGEVSIAGRPDLKAAQLNPRRALQQSLDLLSENRKEEGLALKLSIAANLTLSALKKYGRAGILQLAREQEVAKSWAEKLRIRARDVSQAAGSLSGGNQQKICLARLLHHDSDVLFLDEPTRGIDVGSKAEIYRLIQELAQSGKAIVVVSSYLPELFGICDTLAVMHRGELSTARPIAEWTEQQVMLFATSAVLH